MKYYTQFTHVENKKTVVDNLGSRGVYILDGRNTLTSMKCDSLVRMNRLKKVSKIDGYKIIKSDRFDNDGIIIYEWIRSGARDI